LERAPDAPGPNPTPARSAETRGALSPGSRSRGFKRGSWLFYESGLLGLLRALPKGSGQAKAFQQIAVFLENAVQRSQAVRAGKGRSPSAPEAEGCPGALGRGLYERLARGWDALGWGWQPSASPNSERTLGLRRLCGRAGRSFHSFCVAGTFFGEKTGKYALKKTLPSACCPQCSEITGSPVCWCARAGPWASEPGFHVGATFPTRVRQPKAGSKGQEAAGGSAVPVCREAVPSPSPETRQTLCRGPSGQPQRWVSGPVAPGRPSLGKGSLRAAGELGWARWGQSAEGDEAASG